MWNAYNLHVRNPWEDRCYCLGYGSLFLYFFFAIWTFCVYPHLFCWSGLRKVCCKIDGFIITIIWLDMGASVSAVSFMVLPLVAVWITTSIRKHWWMKVNNIQWKKPLLNGHLRDLSKCPLNRGCKNCAMFVNENAWRLLCTVVKFHVVKETLYFVQDF